MKVKHILVLAFLFIIINRTFCQVTPAMRYEDKIRIKEAFAICKATGDKIWKGINDVPFVVLLVFDSTEFLINHPYPSKDFKTLGMDSILNAEIFYRPKQYPDWYLATFPAVNGVSCIVVGTPEKTNKNSTDWIVTLLHEHFHQYEFASQDYFKSVDELGLSGGDKTGMWQLNYAFPYDSAVVTEQYKKYMTALSSALANMEKPAFNEAVNNYITERSKFKKLLKPADYRYFSLQVWQEGIARYTEYKFLEALETYKPSIQVAQLPDFISFNKHKEEFYTSQVESLTKASLPTDKRICFYAIGFAEGLLLDKLNPAWHNKFLTDKFYVEHYSNKFKQ